MTQEEKQILFKDLCARLPYGVKILDIPANVVGDLYLISTTDAVEYEPVDETNDDDNTGVQTLYNIKPYLRPRSSMTEEEKEEYEMLQVYPGFKTNHTDLTDMYDFLNAHHLDYRGLIPMGLALEALEGMYKTE